MSATNDPNRFVYPDNLTQDWLVNVTSGVADAIAVGDLMYDAGSDVARPGNKMTSLTTAELDQAQFAAAFAGVSQQAVLAAESGAATKRVTVRTYGVCEFNCPSQTWAKGALFGIFSDGAALDPQKVTAVSHPALAVGVTTRAYLTATTRVQGAIFARRSWDIAHNWGRAPSLFDGQSVATANALTDANQTLTVASALIQTIVPTANRDITLPAVAQSKGLAFIVRNNSGGSFNAVVKNAGGTTILTVGQAKTGWVFCDGTTWFGLLGA